jgi:hypothetical protein
MSHSLRLLLASWLVIVGVTAVGTAGVGRGIAAPRPGAAQPQTLVDRQSTLLATALGALQQPASGGPSLYFVGFAGYGSQAVFKREVLAVRELFDSRFGTRGRSVALINHPSTVASTPLATSANLEVVLGHVGRVMDKDRDTLFLFLTSHGEKGLLAVELPGTKLAALTPAGLRSMLDRSRIRNRVIVISACHSGSFIPALSGPTSLVIAAAHADRSSFGCEDRRQWTYFGDAYFNRALRAETSFTLAFTQARQLVSRWERAGKLVPSLPQMAGGEALPFVDWAASAAARRP